MMTKSQHNRRNFLSSIAILSAGTLFGSGVKPFQLSGNNNVSLIEKWKSFCKSHGGYVVNREIDFASNICSAPVKGHHYKTGEMILFKGENILAQPTWTYWGNDQAEPSDVVITLFENNGDQKKITRLNRFELDALCKLSKDFTNEALLFACNNSLQTVPGNLVDTIKSKTIIRKNSESQQVSYYKNESLVYYKKFISNA